MQFARHNLINQLRNRKRFPCFYRVIETRLLTNEHVYFLKDYRAISHVTVGFQNCVTEALRKLGVRFVSLSHILCP